MVKHPIRYAICVAILVSASVVTAGESLSSDGKTLLVDIAAGETNNLSSAYISNLTGNSVTNLLKLGEGTLIVDSNLSAYSGAVTVERGVYRVTTENGAGKGASAPGGAVTVKSGGTFEIAYDSPSGIPYKTFYFEGDGAYGRGALVSALTSSRYDFSAFGTNMVMTGDAVIGAIGSSATYIHNRASGTLGVAFNMNGYTLTLRMESTAILFTYPHFKNRGDIRLESGTLTFQNASSGNTLGEPGKTLSVSNAASLRFNGLAAYTGHSLDFSSSGSIIAATFPAARMSETNINYWCGPVHIGVDRANVRSVVDFSAVTFCNAVSGGGFHVAPQWNGCTCSMHLVSPYNTFTSGVVAVNGSLVHLWRNGSLPSDGGALSMTDSHVMLELPSENYSLPALRIDGSGASSAYRGTTGSWTGGIVKSGNGDIYYGSAISAPLLKLESGTFTLPEPSKSPRLAGLIEGVKWGNQSETQLNSVTGIYGAAVYTNGISSSALAADDWTAPIWYRPAGESRSYMIVTYSGYIWNRSETTQRWSFMSCAYQKASLRMDGDLVLQSGPASEVNVKFAPTNTIEVSPGYHSFNYRIYTWYSGTQGGWPYKGVTNVVAVANPNNSSYAALGFGIDRQGRGSANMADYEKAIDPGDGSLFTWDVPGKGEYVHPLTGETIPENPVFDKIEFCGGTLDLNGRDFTISDMEGRMKLANASNITVNGTWQIDAADVETGSPASLSGRLAFAPGAKIAIGIGNGMRRLAPGALFEIAVAEDGISGDVIVESEWFQNAKAVVSADGKHLSLVVPPKGIVVTVR